MDRSCVPASEDFDTGYRSYWTRQPEFSVRGIRDVIHCAHCIGDEVVGMLAMLTLELEARDSVANRLRRWQIAISHDLLGTWVADVQFGRIGSLGRQVRLVFESQSEVDDFLRQRLRRRATAKRRIGVAYHYVRASHEVRTMLTEFGIQPAGWSAPGQVKAL